MSQAVRDHLTANPKADAKETLEVLLGQNPKLNKSSFSVAYYTTRRKMGGGSTSGGKRGRKVGIHASKPTSGGRVGTGHSVNMEALQHAAKFLREVGGADAALEAIKQVQAVQFQ